MSGILGANGEPATPSIKDWNDMTQDERMDVLRHGVGHLIRVTEHIGRSVDKIIAALEEAEKSDEIKTPA